MRINRFFWSFISVFLLVSFSACNTKKVPLPQQTIPELTKTIQPQQPATEITPPIKIISIAAVGDIMLGTNFPSANYLPTDGGMTLLSETSAILNRSDIVFGNLEGSFSNSGKCYKACSDPSKCYAFRMPEDYVHHLKKAGFNLLSIANNHIGDFGLPGREKTIELLTKTDINFAGVDTHPSTTFTKNGVNYGFCAFAPNFGTPDLRDIESACETVKKLSLVCDIVIVSFHGGAEGAENRHITRDVEFFYGENRGNIYEFSHKVIDAGADIVFGHGPHISRAIELYKDRFITYSMGNFCTYGRFNLQGLNGIAPLFKLNVDKKGMFLSGKIIPLIQEYKKGPAVDEMKRAIKEISELTAEDFPETGLSIHSNGVISKTN